MEEHGLDVQAGLSWVLEGRSEGGVPAMECEWMVSNKSRFMGWCECVAVTMVAWEGLSLHTQMPPASLAGIQLCWVSGGNMCCTKLGGSGGWRPSCRP